MQYLPGADFLLESRLVRSMHFSSDVINTVFELNCIRLRSWLMMRITCCLLRCKRHSIVYMKSFLRLKPSPFTYVTKATSMNYYPDALLKFTKDPSSHADFLSSFRFFLVCVLDYFVY